MEVLGPKTWLGPSKRSLKRTKWFFGDIKTVPLGQEKVFGMSLLMSGVPLHVSEGSEDFKMVLGKPHY